MIPCARPIASFLVAASLGCACGEGEHDAGVCCPPPTERFGPEFQITPGGQCLVRWSTEGECLRTSYEPELEPRADTIEATLTAWSPEGSLLCFGVPIEDKGGTEGGQRWLHFLPANGASAPETVLFEGATGVIVARN
jgi:hypothetical protein